MIERLKAYLRLMRFDKPIGILLLLWPTLWAVWIAGKGKPNLWIVFVFVMGTVLMRAAGCAINDFADRNFDGHVVRTQFRPLPSGAIKPAEAVMLFMICSLVSFALVLTLNLLTIILSVVALALAASYPFMKRYTHWPQLVLGLAFSFGIPMAFAAETNHIPNIAWAIFSTAVLWSIVYDTQYAMVDREHDLKIGIKSTAILFGHHDVWILCLLQMVILTLFILIGWWLHFTIWYFIGVALAALFAIYQQRLIQNREPKKCFQAFLNNHWFGMSIFLGIALAYLT